MIGRTKKSRHRAKQGEIKRSKHLNIRMLKDELDRLRAYSDAHNVTISSVIRASLSDIISDHPSRANC